VEPNAPKAVERGLELLDLGQQRIKSLRPVDDLVCLPSARMAGGTNFAALLEKQANIEDRQIWRGYDEKDRRIYSSVGGDATFGSLSSLSFGKQEMNCAIALGLS